MRAEERREQVLRCAADLFAEQGYHGTTVEHVVGRAGVARGTFYAYFKDKRSIFDELLHSYMDDIRDHITRIDVSIGQERSLQMMRENLQGVLGVCLRRRALTKILLSEAVGLDEEFDRKLLDFYSEVLELLERTLSQAQGIGLVPEGDVRVSAMCVLGSLKEILYQVIMRGFEVDENELVDSLIKLHRSGLIAI